jgi:hypothetical protein
LEVEEVGMDHYDIQPCDCFGAEFLQCLHINELSRLRRKICWTTILRRDLPGIDVMQVEFSNVNLILVIGWIGEVDHEPILRSELSS